MVRTDLDINDINLKDTIDNDILERNQKLIMLSKLILHSQDNLMISIDGKWGSGKTFFVRQFQYLIEHIDDYNNSTWLQDQDKSVLTELKENSLIVYYNAWENDSHTNILESLIFNILNEYPKVKNQIINFSDFKVVFKSFCRDFLYSVSDGIFDINHFDEIKSFESLEQEILTIEEKKAAFNKLIDSILGQKKKLILVIDELDRCKPTFAVEMLETIKHFYTNDKITVIFSTNNKELSNTIKNYYGYDFDGYGYLNKFYDFIITLEIMDIKKYLKARYRFCISPYIYHDISYEVMKYHDFSLRECNRYITLYNLLKNYIEGEDCFYKDIKYVNTCILLPLILALKIKNIDKYNLVINTKGESIIREFLDQVIDGTTYEMWIKDLIQTKDDEDYKNKIIDVYYKNFKTSTPYNGSSLFNVVSLLGTTLLI